MIQILLRRDWRTVGARCGILLFLAFAVGCGPGKGKVKGQVLLDGKPLPGGTITFRPLDTKYNPAIANIDENGNYEVTVVAGEAVITVDNRALKDPGAASGPIGAGGGPSKGGGRGPGAGPRPPGGASVSPPKDALNKMKEKPPELPTSETPKGKYVAIPERYYDGEKSGLKVTVKGGDQTHNVELASK